MSWLFVGSLEIHRRSVVSFIQVTGSVEPTNTGEGWREGWGPPPQVAGVQKCNSFWLSLNPLQSQEFSPSQTFPSCPISTQILFLSLLESTLNA